MLAEFKEAAASIVRGGSPEIDQRLVCFIQNVLDLEAALEMGFTITLDDVNVLEFRALGILREERALAVQAKQQMAEHAAKARQLAGNTF